MDESNSFNCPVAQLAGHKTENLRRTRWCVFEAKGVGKNCLNFNKMNRCHYLLVPVVVIPLFPNCDSTLKYLIIPPETIFFPFL